MTLPIDRTTKAALDANLVNGNTSDAPVIKASNDVVYNTIDEVNAKVDSLVNTNTLSPYPPSFLSRQALINGNFDIWQSGTSFTNPANLSYTSDQWQVGVNADSGALPTITHFRQQFPTGFMDKSFYFYNMNINGAGSGFGPNAYYSVSQPIEFGTRFLCGTGKKVTVSFYARSSIAGKRIAVGLSQRYGTGGTPSAPESLITTGQIITLSADFVLFTLTFTTNTLGQKTFGNNNDDALVLQFFTMWGDTVATNTFGGGTAETFGGSGVLDIAQVQHNTGDKALPFQPRSYAEEFALCQRYYEKSYLPDTAPGSVSFAGIFQYRTRDVVAASIAGSVTLGMVPFTVPKRVSPNITVYSGNTGAANAVRVAENTDRTGCSVIGKHQKGFYLISVDASSAIAISADNRIDFQWTADARL